MRRLSILAAGAAALLTVAQLAAAQVPASQKAVVDQVFASATWTLQTKAGSGCFTEAVAFTLHQRDPQWGHLRKFGGQNQWNEHAVDAVLHRSTGYAFDIIGSSASAGARPTWNVDKDAKNQPIARYKGNHSSGVPYWFAPVSSCGGATPPAPDPEPPAPPVNDVSKILEALAAQQQQLEQLRAAVAALVAKPDPVVTLPPVEIPPFTLPAFRCRGNTKPFGGALELACEP